MSNFQPNVYLAAPIYEVRAYVLSRWGGVDSGARGDSRHCSGRSSHNAAIGGCKQESPLNGVAYHPNFVHAWDWGHHYAPGYKDVGNYLLHGPGQKYVRYIIMDGTIYYPDHRGGGSEPSSGHTWHMHISWMPGTHNLTGVNWFDSGLGSPGTAPGFNGLNIGGLKVPELSEQKLAFMMIGQSQSVVKQLTQEFKNQDGRTKAMLGVLANAINGDADREEFERLLNEDRQARVVADEELRTAIKNDVQELIENMDVIDGAPADDVAMAVVDLFVKRLGE